MSEDWHARWRAGRIGWHEPDGSAALRRHWPAKADGCSVLVPLCGKAVDLAWLATRGCKVTGVELSELAVRAFFDEQGLDYRRTTRDGLDHWHATALPLTLVCGDWFQFQSGGFDAVFDRGALVAMPAADRPGYASHLDQLLRDDAIRLVVTLEYERSAADGPPWAVDPAEVTGYWPQLREVGRHNDIGNAPPKFREAGLDRFDEVVWLSE